MDDEEGMDWRECRFAELFDRTFVPVVAFVRRRIPNAEVDDVVAEVFLTAWRHIDTLAAADEGALPWLYRTAMHAIYHVRRAAGRRQHLRDRLSAVRESAADESVDVFAWSDTFTQAFNALRANDREVLRLAIWEELDSKDAAAVLGCTPGAFQVRLHRARNRLRRRLERDGVLLPEEPASSFASHVPVGPPQAPVFKENTR